MKQFIVLCSMILLGIAIYNMIMGPEDSSVINMMGDIWEQGIQVRTNNP